jgi:hypothetical protein
MQVPETDIIWPYSLLKVSENKSTSRTGIPIGSAYELIGVDGSSDGGLKPFPGFREMHRFRMSTAPTFPIEGSNPYTGLRHRTKVIDFWSFSVIAGANKRVWGFVYVAKRPNDMTPGSESCSSVFDLMMDYYAPQGAVSTWSSIVLQEAMSDAGVLGTDDSKNNSVMSVETTGRMLYIFRRGVAPVSVFFKYATSPSVSTTPIINESAGPGKKPTVGMYQQGSPAVDADFPATTSATEGHISASFPDPTSAANAPGSVVFCRLDPAVTAAGTAISNIGTGNQFDAGTYSLAVQFEDSRSGRKSQFSQSVEFTFTGTITKKLFVDGIYDSSKFDVVNIYRSVRTQNAAGAYTGGIMQLEARVTLSSYDVATLPMRTAATLPSGGNIKYFRYAYQLKDSALVMQDVFLDRAAFYETMPKGGAGALLDGTMLVGNISEEPGDLTGTGETRWSSSTETSVEMFTAKGQYQPPSVGDAVTCFRRCGQMMVGLTRSGVQYYDKSSGFVKVVPAHQGFGTVGPYAACSVGPVVYYLNYRGLKAAFPDGKLDDVQSIDDLVMDEWYSGTTGAQELTKVSIAFDSATLCMYVLNPTRRTAVQMWFSTGVVSELRDQMFSKVTQGWWEDNDGQLVPRALFLMNAPYPDVVTNTSFGPAVFMPCRTEGDKEYPETGVSEPIYMFDSDSLHALGASSIKVTTPGSMPNYFNDSCTLGSLNVQEVTNVAGTQNPATTSSANASRMIGTWIYTNRSDSKGATDSKHLIVDATTTRILVASTTLTDSYSISIDPVYFKWVGHPLRMSEDANEEFVVKQPSSIGCVFTDVQATTGKAPEWLLWNALLYRNNDTDPYMYSKPTDREGSIVKTSLSTGDSAVWASFDKHGILGQWITPGIEIYLSNVRYRLIGAQVKGRMLPTDRTRRTY